MVGENAYRKRANVPALKPYKLFDHEKTRKPKNTPVRTMGILVQKTILSTESLLYT
jgi:hypothetical protein